MMSAFPNLKCNRSSQIETNISIIQQQKVATQCNKTALNKQIKRSSSLAITRFICLFFFIGTVLIETEKKVVLISIFVRLFNLLSKFETLVMIFVESLYFQRAC